MKVAEIMTPNVHLASPGESLQKIAKRMAVDDKDVKYCFEDEDIEHVAQNMGDIQVRRLPVLNRDKRLVGVVSLADAALKEDPATVGIAMSGVVVPGGAHAR
ncbi:MAG: CBS domain-containing protein [Mesorhizobium sp.]|uniref:CBS domain-containing protein n=1 Tax=Mesorhizobium sp. TaxID=1871066 RepID=UPI00122BA53A|nr:CBS domain-containing protein [Mesorhizobium sp.]TIM05167.1 MAG: CBS domain-containing protein [Mesorhizobium sp.]TIN47725.1 MAG: CBS domain-containing protein [Mesorhizobium sp.]